MSLSDERQQLYSVIGEAITSWIGVEDQLANLFAYFVAGDGKSFPAKASFHQVLNFNTRLATTNAAAAYAEIDHARWKTLYNRLKRKAKLRNELAHFTILRSASIPGDQPYLHLAPSLENVNLLPEPGLTIKDISQALGFRT
jgi:hypothetical protein